LLCETAEGLGDLQKKNNGSFSNKKTVVYDTYRLWGNADNLSAF
jgi:hypothetical protein